LRIEDQRNNEQACARSLPHLIFAKLASTMYLAKFEFIDLVAHYHSAASAIKPDSSSATAPSTTSVSEVKKNEKKNSGIN
jgi:hypothetical protein